MSRVAIITGGESKDACAMGVLAMNIAEVCPHIADELIIYHDGISETDQKLINSFFPTRFQYFSFPLKFIDKVYNSSLRGFTGMVFYKYEFLNLAKEYDKVILTDYDIIIQKDISELRNLCGLNVMQGSALKNNFWKTVPKKKIRKYNSNTLGICAPLIVVDWKKEKSCEELDRLYKKCIDLTYEFARYIKSPEEVVLSMLIQEEGLKYNLLDSVKYCTSCRDTVHETDASILHAIGRPKFWDGLHNEAWDKRYKRWLEAGGSPYHEPFKRRLVRYTYEGSIRNLLRKMLSY